MNNNALVLSDVAIASRNFSKKFKIVLLVRLILMLVVENYTPF